MKKFQPKRKRIFKFKKLKFTKKTYQEKILIFFNNFKIIFHQIYRMLNEFNEKALNKKIILQKILNYLKNLMKKEIKNY